MKTKVFFFTIFLVFPLFLFAEDSIKEVSEEVRQTDTLYFMGSRNISIDNEGKGTLIPPEELVFTENDIQYFNLITEEIVFTDSFVSDTLNFIIHFRTYPIYNIYLNDKLLLDNVESTIGNSSRPINDLVFYIDAYKTNKIFLNYGYPLGPAGSFPGWMQQESETKI